MKHLESFENAAEFVGKDPKVLPGTDGLTPEDAKAVIAAYKLSVISAAAWKDHGGKPDWSDDDQLKYYPWFDMEPSVGSASGFSFHDYLYDFSYSSVGSRHVFPDRDTAEYVGKNHLGIYRDFMVID